MGRRLSKDLVVLQILSVLLAVVLWMQATSVQNPVDRFTFDGVSVVVGDVPDGSIATDAPHPAKVNLTVKCRRRVADRLTSAAFSARVSLAGGRVGSADYPVEVIAPEGVEVVDISPAAVTVTLEQISTTQVPVDVNCMGSPATGYAPGEAMAIPNAVTVRGPASAVNRVASVLAKVDVSGATSDVTAAAVLEAVDSTGTTVYGVTFSPSEVAVTVPVLALPAAESLDVDPILTGSPAEGYAVLRITCTPVRVQVRPSPGASIDFDHVTTSPVDITGSTSDVTAMVDLVKPAGAAEIVPSQVQVVVEIGASLTLKEVPIGIRNVPEGLKGELDPGAVEIVVRGPRALLDRLVAGDLVPWVDAADCQAGQSSLHVNIDMPDWAGDDLEVSLVNPQDVTLTLRH